MCEHFFMSINSLIHFEIWILTANLIRDSIQTKICYLQVLPQKSYFTNNLDPILQYLILQIRSNPMWFFLIIWFFLQNLDLIKTPKLLLISSDNDIIISFIVIILSYSTSCCTKEFWWRQTSHPDGVCVSPTHLLVPLLIKLMIQF